MSEEPQSGNPYNHHSAVKDPNYFVGREDELKNIKYDLDQAKSDRPQYVNIGITGKEGAGKSSLSYMVQEEAEKRGFFTVRVNLDKSLVSNEVSLFQRIYEGIVTNIGGKVEDSYLNAVRGAVDQIEVNLKFLKAYIGANNQDDLNVSEGIVRNDFEELYSQVNSSAITIVLDNAQHLAESPVALQKLKNVFSDIDGYILVLSGTEDTFSNISDAFSPVARMFNKFRIGPFEKYEETKKCLLRPLSEEEKELISDRTIREIHKLTGGRPYEINLIGYCMYRRYDRGEQEVLQLSSDVIDSVLDQMEEWRRSVDNDLPDKVKGLNQEEIRTLVAAIEFSDVPKEWLAEYVILSEFDTVRVESHKDEKEKRIKDINTLLNQGILEEEAGEVSFAGDFYALAYVKYHAIANDIISDIGTPVGSDTDEVVANIHYRLVNNILLDNVGKYGSLYIKDGSRESSPMIGSIVEHDTLEEAGVESPPMSPLRDRTVFQGPVNEIIKETSRSMETEIDIDVDEIEHITFRCNVSWLGTGFLSMIYLKGDGDKEKLYEEIESISGDLETLGYNINIEDEMTLTSEGINHAQKGNVDVAIEKFSKAIEMNEAYLDAWNCRAKAYFEKGELDKALDDINEAINLMGEQPREYVRKARIYLAREEEDKAARTLQKAKEVASGDDKDTYSTVCCLASSINEHELAIESGEQALQIDQESPRVIQEMAIVKQEQGNTEEALQYCEKLLRLEDDEFDMAIALNTKGGILLEEKEYKKANGVFDNALELEIDDREAKVVLLMNKASSEIHQGNREAAKDALKKAKKEDKQMYEQLIEDSDEELKELFD